MRKSEEKAQWFSWETEHGATVFIPGLLFEAKLTESDFQWAHPRMIDRYRDLEEISKR